MEETNMLKGFVLIILAVIALVGVIASSTEDDETTIELSDEEAEEYRKRLIEREEKDVELDKE